MITSTGSLLVLLAALVFVLCFCRLSRRAASSVRVEEELWGGVRRSERQEVMSDEEEEEEDVEVSAMLLGRLSPRFLPRSWRHLLKQPAALKVGWW